MERRKAMSGMRIGPAEAAPGGHDTANVAPELAGDDKENDLMRHVAHNQRRDIRGELDALGPGRAPGYRGKDEATADARAIVEDPRFAKRYALDRETDRGGAAGRAVAGAKQKVSDFMASDDKGAQIGKAAARTAVRSVPLVGSGVAIGGAVKEHQRAGVDDAIAADAGNDDLTRSAAAGLADTHRKGRNKEAVSAVVGLAKTGVAIGTGGLGALIPDLPGMGVGDAASGAGGSLLDRALAAPGRGADAAMAAGEKALAPDKLAVKAGWKAANKGGGAGVNKAADWWDDKRSAHQMRPDAVAPQDRGSKERVAEGTDRANEGLMQLAAGDGAFGSALIGHLTEDSDLDLNSPQSVMDATRAADPRPAKEQHTLKPSMVKRLVDGEGARDRQNKRMGETLHTMEGNEGRSWWEK
jgi:hypothetical protein